MKKRFGVRILSGHIGAEIAGLDLKALDDGEVAAVRAAWLEHKVVFFPGQELAPGDLARAAARFGKVEALHDGLRRHPDDDRVLLVETRDGEGDGPNGASWHSDVTFAACPPMASMMLAVELPPVGGDTLFASMTAAWDALSPPLKAAVEGLEAFHDGLPYFAPYLRNVAPAEAAARIARLRAEEPGAVHPVVRVHEETGKKALFVNRPFTQRLIGLSEIESRRLLDLLIEHCEQPSFQLRWRWRKGDVAFWDNRHAMHYPAYDYGLHHRAMHRVTLAGTRPRGPRDSGNRPRA